MRIAVYTGSFDPMTLGHLDVITRASKLFDRLIVAVGEAREKKPLFSVTERIDLVKAVCVKVKNIEVASFSGLAVDYAAQMGAICLIRGLRSTADYSYEMQMALMNRAMKPAIETVFFPTSPEYSHISSSLAKDIALHGGDMNLLVPPLVSKRLAEKMAGSR